MLLLAQEVLAVLIHEDALSLAGLVAAYDPLIYLIRLGLG